MLYHLLKDMLDILRLRYKHHSEYRYTFITTIAVLILIGFVNAAGMASIFGHSSAVIIFAILFSVIKWLLLSHIMRLMLSYHGSEKLPLKGFVLASEALIIPSLTVFYLPALTFFGLFWQIWIFWVQAFGFAKMSNVSAGKIILGYIFYFVILMIMGTLLLTAFNHLSLIDLGGISAQIDSMLNQPTPSP